MIKHILLTVLLAVGCINTSFASASSKMYDNFKQIPVLHEGRLKPLDTYARNLLIQFSGKDSFDRQAAIIWFSKVLFTPEKTFKDKVFLINNPDIATALGIKSEEHRRYSWEELKPSFNKIIELEQAARNIDEKQRSIVENEIIRVSSNIRIYVDYTRQFSWAFPTSKLTLNSATIKSDLELSANRNAFSFFEIALRAGKIKEILVGLKSKKEQDLTNDQKDLMNMMSQLVSMSDANKNLPLSLLPVRQHNDWFSPWDAIGLDFQNQSTRELLSLWQQMAWAYSTDNLLAFNMVALQYNVKIKNALNPTESKVAKKFQIEIIYHGLMPFLWAKIFYILAFIFFVISFTSSKSLWYWLGLASVMGGFIPHTLGMVGRIYIMSRPPVTNLYETFIFVGFVAVFLGLCIEHFNRKWLGIIIAAVSGIAMLFIASRYAAEGDTLKMLVAVLDSNFWLATHVTTITMGYGATCVAGILGHIWLIQAALGKNKEILDSTYKTTLGIMGVSLTLTFLGTNLGGIWADQSWGRFWGWDPKENGALMIVLWVAMLFHAKFSKMIDEVGIAVGCVIGTIVVMWAWFGVNLLSIGLHSYGFTSGIANTLLIYVCIEILFIIITLITIRSKSSIKSKK